MTIVNPQIYYPSTIDETTGGLTAQTTAAFDLRWIRGWYNGPAVGTLATATVWVQYDTSGGTRVGPWPKAEFEAAKTASLLDEAANGY